MAGSRVSCNVFLLLSITMVIQHSVHAAVPAVYIFGDSTVDVGTNNRVYNPLAKANNPYNGIDFPGSKATGRFSNGLNSADFLSKLMGFQMSPKPYLDLLDKNNRTTKHVIKGANFASGGCGIQDRTGATWIVGSVNLTGQIQQFAAVRKKLENLLGHNATDSFISKSIFIISLGSNDILENSYADNRSLSKQEFITTLTDTYENQLRILHSHGARKFGIISVPNIGCCPSQRIHNATLGCMEDVNHTSQMLYSALKAMLRKLSTELKEMKYSLGNAYEMVTYVMDNPQPFNFKELSAACCGNGKGNGGMPCSVTAKLCSNRDEYLFWDWYHPTQAASELAAQTLFLGSTRFVTPINFKQLADI